MPRNTSGIFSLSQTAFVPQTAINAGGYNGNMDDIATTLTFSVDTTGVSNMTGPLLMFNGVASNPGIAFASNLNTGFYASNANETSVAVNGVQIAKLNASGLTMLGSGSNITDKNSNIIYGLPIGTVLPFAGTALYTNPPAKWLYCYGQAISRTTYAVLFAAISTTFGSGNGSTTYNLPDMRGRAAFGKDNMGGVAATRITTGGSGVDGATLGATGGTQNVTIAKANLPSFNATKSDPTHTHKYTGPVISVGVAGGGSFISNQTNSPNTGSQTINTDWTTGGSGTAMVNLNNAIMLNYMIFTGV